MNKVPDTAEQMDSDGDGRFITVDRHALCQSLKK